MAEAIASWLNDERRGVTYSWVARELCVSSAAAAGLLDAYLRAAPPASLRVHYLVCGTARAKLGDAGARSDALLAPHVVAIVAA